MWMMRQQGRSNRYFLGFRGRLVESDGGGVEDGSCGSGVEALAGDRTGKIGRDFDDGDFPSFVVPAVVVGYSLVVELDSTAFAFEMVIRVEDLEAWIQLESFVSSL
jgi:hypothetical protein